MSEGPQEVIRQLRTLAHARLFGDGPWFAHGETYDALSRKDEAGLYELDPDNPDFVVPSPLGREVNVRLMIIFLGLYHDTFGEIPMILEEYGLITQQEMDELYEHENYAPTVRSRAEIIGAEPDNSTTSESILLPFVRRAFLQYCGATSGTT
jgi:hypothetical protein